MRIVGRFSFHPGGVVVPREYADELAEVDRWCFF